MDQDGTLILIFLILTLSVLGMDLLSNAQEMLTQVNNLLSVSIETHIPLSSDELNILFLIVEISIGRLFFWFTLKINESLHLMFYFFFYCYFTYFSTMKPFIPQNTSLHYKQYTNKSIKQSLSIYLAVRSVFVQPVFVKLFSFNPFR